MPEAPGNDYVIGSSCNSKRHAVRRARFGDKARPAETFQGAFSCCWSQYFQPWSNQWNPLTHAALRILAASAEFAGTFVDKQTASQCLPCLRLQSCEIRNDVQLGAIA
jgi:hypothetical protein